MVFRYWVEFDEFGNISGLYSHKEDCVGECQEYLVKLIPIHRANEQENSLKDLIDGTDSFSKEIQKLTRTSKRMTTELDKVIKKKIRL